MQIIDILKLSLSKGDFIAFTLNGRRQRDPSLFEKLEVKPARIQGEKKYQLVYAYPRKTTQENLTAEEFVLAMERLIPEFRQGSLCTSQSDYLLITNKKGDVHVQTRPPSRIQLEEPHDRLKNRLIPENQPCDFLIRLGVMRPDGKVHANRYDKFRQVNRFLELVADTLPNLPAGEPIRIFDLGCGKSYLTFALYYYLRRILNREVEITGLDLKEDVIAHCESLARELKYEGLNFVCGDIGSFELSPVGEKRKIDMIVSLHACDTATDEVLAQAVKREAKVILSAPCCQHELFRQISSEVMRPLLKHGVLKERFAALLTDALRGEMLEAMGYSVQIIEFIETEHTPKNLLIRAVRTSNGAPEAKRAQSLAEYKACRDFWGADPALEKALENITN